MIANLAQYKVTWEKLPEDFPLPNEPVDNINQPLLAAALTESLEIAGLIPETALITTNYGICATVNGKMVIKAPDWAYIPAIRVPRSEVSRSYTPQLQGDIPIIAIEFLSDTQGEEYSVKPTYPQGKWLFYEQILQIPNYAIFAPENGELEIYRLDNSGKYNLQQIDANDRYWIAEIDLFLGVWQGKRENRTGYWLRWWDRSGELLLWGAELAQRERDRSERLAARLRELGEDPNLI